MRNKARLSITGSVGENGRVLTPDCPKAVHTGPPLRQSSGLALVSSELPWKPKTSQVPYSSNNENNKIKTIIAPPTKQPETNHKEKTGFTHPTGHLQWARRDRTEAQTITPTVRAHDLLWLSDSSRKSVETRGRTISILFLFIFFSFSFSPIVWSHGGVCLNQRVMGIHWSHSTSTTPVTEEEPRGRTRIISWQNDTDKDQKTVNLKRKTVLFFVGVGGGGGGV